MTDHTGEQSVKQLQQFVVGSERTPRWEIRWLEHYYRLRSDWGEQKTEYVIGITDAATVGNAALADGTESVAVVAAAASAVVAFAD